jgi:hypothetical protein
MFRRSGSKVAAFLLLLAAPSSAFADARLHVNYLASLTGIQVGRGEFIVDISDSAYAAAGSAKVTGIAKLVSSGHGAVSASGNFIGGNLSPTSYATNSVSDKKKDEIHMALANSVVTQFSVNPPIKPSKKRIPVTEDDRRGVVDPMSAAIISVPGTGDILSPDNCKRTLPIFDGRQRYDLVFHYERMESAKDVKGYSGKMLVCRVDYKPIAGHKPDRMQVKYMEDNKNIFVWLAPIKDTRVLFPIRVSIVTLIGVVVVQAESFVTTPREGPAVSPDAIK